MCFGGLPTLAAAGVRETAFARLASCSATSFMNITVAKTLEAKLRGQHASLEKDVAEQDAKRAKAVSRTPAAASAGKPPKHNGKAPRSRPSGNLPP